MRSPAVCQRRWRELQQAPDGLRPVSVAVIASYTVDTFLPYLGCVLAERGLLARFTVAPFGQVYQSLLDRESAVATTRADVTLVLVRLEDLAAPALRTLSLLDPGESRAARADVDAEIGRLCRAIAAFEAATSGVVLVGTLPSPASTPLGVLDPSHAASVEMLVRECNVALWRELRAQHRVRLLDVDRIAAQLGAAQAWDPRMALLASCPWSSAGLAELAAWTGRAIAATVLPTAKVVVLDVDETLWGGVVGEDGRDGIALGPTGLGAAFLAFQDALLALRAQGVLLAVASKNNEPDVLDVLDRHPEMRIRSEHLAAYRIGWGPKSRSLREISEQLGLATDSFVFLDDSAAECAEVRAALPEVTVVHLPPEPARYVDALRAVARLDRMALTYEDRTRAASYGAVQRRAAERAAVDADPDALRAHLRSLGVVAKVRRIGESEVARAAQLTQKTNQFNLTTVRRTEAEIEALRRDPAWRLYALDVSDRFGAYGTTGLLFARRADDTTWDVETLLLSCRVLGRGVESALLRAATGDLLGAGARRLTGRWVATEKNAPARDFLERHGFVAGVKEPLPGASFDDDHIELEVP